MRRVRRLAVTQATLPHYLLFRNVWTLAVAQKNFFGHEVPVVAAGGIYDGRGLGASLMLGAVGAWIGTRFIACEEANASPVHKKRLLEASSNDMTRTEAFTGRPCRVLRTPYVKSWEERPEELRKFLSQGIVPFSEEIKDGKSSLSEFFPALMGQCAGGVKNVKTADAIVQDLMNEALTALRSKPLLISRL